MRPRDHDDVVRHILIHRRLTDNLQQLIPREISEIIKRLDALLAQRHQHRRRERLDRRDLIGHTESDALVIQLIVTLHQEGVGTPDQLFRHGLIKPFDIRQLIHRHKGQFFDGVEPFLHQQAGNHVIHIQRLNEQAGAPAEFLLAALGFLGLGENINVPPGQLARQTHILPAPTNGQAQLVIRHHHLNAPGLLIHHHLGDFSRRQRIHHECRGLGRPGDDIDLLALQFRDNGLHARTTHPHAGTHRIDRAVP